MPQNHAVRDPAAGWLNVLGNWLPAVAEARTYSWLKLRRDTFAGLTVAAVAVPQSMAYASIFGMPVQYGLYTAIVMTAVGSLFNGSRHLINGPTNAISIAMLSALAIVPEEQRIPAAIMMALLIGIIQTAITLFRLGDLSRFISSGVIVGFTCGASILLLLDQLKNVLGFVYKADPHDHFLKRFGLTMYYGGPIHWPTVTVSLATVAIALGCRWINKRWKVGLPEFLLAIVGAALIAWASGDRLPGLSLVGKVPNALPGFALPTVDWSLATQLASSATAIAFLGLLEAIAMAKSLASKTGQKLDSNQQCLSEGLANIAGSFFQCFPGSGSLTRSYINHTAGAMTQWSGIICAAAVAVTVLLLGPLAAFIPKAALAGVLMLTGLRMVEFAALRYHWRATRFDRAIVVATAMSAVFISIEFCILIGVILSFLLYVPRAAQVLMSELTITPDRKIRELEADDHRCELFRIFNFEGELFFGCGPPFEEALERIDLQVGDRIVVIMLRMKRLRNPDAMCLEILHRWVQAKRKSGVVVLLSGVRPDLDDAMKNVGLDKIIGPEHIFRESQEIYFSTMAALRKAYQILGTSRCANCSNQIAVEEWSYDI